MLREQHSFRGPQCLFDAQSLVVEILFQLEHWRGLVIFYMRSAGLLTLLPCQEPLEEDDF
jgi:hypothetical protein